MNNNIKYQIINTIVNSYKILDFELYELSCI
jgi:hypothetical protein